MKIKCIQDWRDAQANICHSQAQLLYFMDISSKDNEFEERAKEAYETWRGAVAYSATASLPARDFLVRRKAWAFSTLTSMGQNGNEDVYSSLYNDPVFKLEVDVVEDIVGSEECRKQYDLGNDLEVSYFIEASAAYYCNRLLNLADGRDRDLFSENSDLHQRLLLLTQALENQRKFDEIFIARTGILYTLMYRSLQFLRPKDEQGEWFRAGYRMLSELNRPIL